MLIVYGADVLLKTDRGIIAAELTISMDIKSMLEDVGQAQKQTTCAHKQLSQSPTKFEQVHLWYNVDTKNTCRRRYVYASLS